MGKNGIDHEANYGNGADESSFDDDILDEDELEEIDDELEEHERIVGYEQLCSMIVQALGRTSLKLYHFQNLLNLNTLDREFKVVIGQSNGNLLNRVHGAAAELTLLWEASNSLLSIYGHEGLCAPYHDTEEWCSHQEMGASPIVDLALKYRAPEAAIKSIRDDDDVSRVAEQLRGLFSGDNAEGEVDVSFEAMYARGELQLTSAVIQYDVTLEDELSDAELLQNILNDLAREIAANLKKMAAAFPTEKSK